MKSVAPRKGYFCHLETRRCTTSSAIFAHARLYRIAMPLHVFNTAYLAFSCDIYKVCFFHSILSFSTSILSRGDFRAGHDYYCRGLLLLFPVSRKKSQGPFLHPVLALPHFIRISICASAPGCKSTPGVDPRLGSSRTVSHSYKRVEPTMVFDGSYTTVA